MIGTLIGVAGRLEITQHNRSRNLSQLLLYHIVVPLDSFISLFVRAEDSRLIWRCLCNILSLVQAACDHYVERYF